MYFTIIRSTLSRFAGLNLRYTSISHAFNTAVSPRPAGGGANGETPGGAATAGAPKGEALADGVPNGEAGGAAGAAGAPKGPGVTGVAGAGAGVANPNDGCCCCSDGERRCRRDP